MVTPLNKRKELFSKAFLNSICAKAGYSIEFREEYDCGIDGSILQIMEDSNGNIEETGLAIDFQLKCTGRTRFMTSEISYPLRNKNYNKLAKNKSNNAKKGILILVTIPIDFDSCLEQNFDKMVLKKCVHWKYLEGKDPVENNENNTTIHIKNENILTPEKIDELFQIFEKGGDLYDAE